MVAVRGRHDREAWMVTPYEEEIERWRRARIGRLTAPDGWLSLAGLWWLRQGSNSVGSDPARDVALPSGSGVSPDAGVIEVEGMRATLHALPGSGLTHEGEPVTTLELRPGSPDTATVVRSGSTSFHLIRREDELAARVRDQDRVRQAGFAGIEHFPVDPAWRIEAVLEPPSEPREVVMAATAGPGERYLVAGSAVFRAPGADEQLMLTAFDEDPDSDLFFVFGDLTNADRTYQGGRFMYMPRPSPDGRMVLDFNQSYNPPCVFTPFAACPMPLPENRLPIRVEAGELRYAAGSTEGSNAPNAPA
jgi:uncharacterized protein (DUF1684 family)